MELSGKQKAAVLIIIGGVSCLLVASMLYDYFSSKNQEEEVEAPSATMEMPDAMVDEVEESKTEAYRRTDVRNVDKYWDDSAVSDDDIDEILEGTAESENKSQGSGGASSSSRSSSSSSSHGGGKRTEAAPITVDDLFDSDEGKQSSKKGSSASSGRSSSASSSGSGTQKRETGEERKQRYERERQEAAARAAAGSGAVTTSDLTGQQEGSAGTTVAEEKEERVVLGEDATIRKAEAGSSLDENSDSYGEAESEEDDYPFQCMFVRQTRLKNGDRVAVRLLEDMEVNGVLVQKNTHLMAYCSIDERVKLEISNINVRGKLYRINYEAYDMDGGLGIYCPDLNNGVGKQVKSTGSNLINRIIGTKVNSIAREVVNTGVSIAGNAGSDISVTVPAGYTFFIVKKKKQ